MRLFVAGLAALLVGVVPLAPVLAENGTGGDTGPAATVSTTSDAPINASSTGGNGSAPPSTSNGGNGGDGGAGGAVSITFTGSTLGVGGGATAIAGATTGGIGGSGNAYVPPLGGLGFGTGGAGGNGGSGGPVAISVTGKITTGSGNGIFAQSSGALGGNGQAFDGGFGDGGAGGTGGATGGISVTLNSGGSIGTSGGYGILVQSLGGLGGNGGYDSSFASSAGAGGKGGNTGTVTVSTAAGTTISTSGNNASALAVQNFAGNGGLAGTANDVLGSGGAGGGTGGQAGAVPSTGGNPVAISIGNAANLTTTGAGSFGIVAQTISGAGGAGGSVSGLFATNAASGSAAGALGDINVTNSGAISTSGQVAHGIVLQSIGGNGGAAGTASGSIVALGGNNSNSTFSAGGGAINLTNSGTIGTAGGPNPNPTSPGSTSGYNGSSQFTSDFASAFSSGAFGLLAQSIGGGGGDGGNSEGLIAIGGSGGSGGGGGTVNVTNSGEITTVGQGSNGIVVQSIGGGGGNGGNALAVGTVNAIPVAIGGSGGSGGGGGTINVGLIGGGITTAGTNAAGLLVQSIGGGGGNGGAAYSYNAASPIAAAAVAVGGTGAAGGQSGLVTVTAANTTISTGGYTTTTGSSATPTAPNTLPSNAFGILAQSIGGGGGNGGAATAEALSLAVPLLISEGLPAFTTSVSVAVGGSGSAGGNGNQAFVNLGTGTTVITQGQGSNAIVAQSIGGGGGNGGDSSAMAATIGYGRAGTATDTQVISLDVDVAVGGSGQAGGNGGLASVTIGNATSSAQANRVTTYGDFADGLMVQSIGGGGGNGGIGSSTTQNFGSTLNYNFSVGVGGTGSAGGNGGQTNAFLGSGNTITTYGSGANAILAQSIGGGGGASQGVEFAAGVSAQFGLTNDTTFLFAGDNAPVNVTPGAKLGVNVGEVGGSGGVGGNVSVGVLGTIVTSGGNADGVLAQSIGGGGGLGGSLGSDASADNPVLIAGAARNVATNAITLNSDFTTGLNISVGGSGGSGGNGGAVMVQLAGGSITTLGDWADGVLAQSIGGGGGLGGAAQISGFPFKVSGGITVGSGGHLDANFNFQGGSGPNGSGGPVQLPLSGGTVSTSGYAAFGLVGQSVGGGGGQGGNGSTTSTSTITVGGGSGGIGDGGTVTIPQSSSATVSISGQNAIGILLQSVGGGGGIGGVGNSQSSGTGSYGLTVGGGSGANGGGGAVSSDGTFTIKTTGATSFGFVAQSVGGGGGIAFTPSLGSINGVELGGTSSAKNPYSDSALCNLSGGNSKSPANCGGPVSVTLASGSAISTSGNGSHALIAQSVGGGGGIAGYSPGSGGLQIAGATKGFNSNGGGGAVTVSVNGNITTTGQGAYGILAQSVGGGGGLGDGGGAIAGATGSNGSSGGGGSVSITQAGTVSTSGINSIGIFAQSTSPSSSANGTVSINVTGTVTGGGGPSTFNKSNIQGMGVFVDGGTSSNSITIDNNASVSAASGLAIAYTGSQKLDVTNYGKVTGSTYLTDAPGTFDNFGTFNQGPAIDANVVDETGSLTTITGPAGSGRSEVNGDFTLNPGARLLINADFNGGTADNLTIDGAATLSGQVQIVGQTILPNRAVPFLTLNGPADLTGLQVLEGALIDYSLSRAGNLVSVTAAGANFTPPGFALSTNQREIANGLQAVWNAGGNAAFAPIFAGLETTAESGSSAYSSSLGHLAPGTSLAIGSQLSDQAQYFAGALMSCPELSGPDALVIEGGCAWAKPIGRVTNQWGDSNGPGFTLASAGSAFGGQAQIAPNWFLGGAAAYQGSWLNGDDNSFSANGQTGYLGAVVKYQSEPWLFAAALSGSYGSYDSTRSLSALGTTTSATASPNTQSVDLRLRAAYSIVQGDWYARPNLNLDVIYARVPGYNETAASPLGLSFATADQTSFVGTPGMELGKRFDLADGSVVRAYVTGGVSLSTSGTWRTTTFFTGAPAGTGFSTSLPQSDVVGRIGIGAQLFTLAGVDLRAQYDGEIAGNMVGHSGQLTAAVHF